MVEQFASFHCTKHIKLHDNMAQIILPSKINSMNTSNEIQNHQKDTAQTKIAHCMGTSNDIQYRLTDSMPKEVRNHVSISNEIQYHPIYFWGQFLSSLFDKSLVIVCETCGTGSARDWKWDAKRRRIQHKMGMGTAAFSTKNKDICYKQMSFYASNICVMVANAVSNCYKRRCSGSLRCSSLIML